MIKMKKKRPCKVSTTRWENMKVVPLEFEGLFHDWGQEAIETNEQGFGNFTVAIIEDQSGQVHTVNPNHVKFLDK